MERRKWCGWLRELAYERCPVYVRCLEYLVDVHFDSLLAGSHCTITLRISNIIRKTLGWTMESPAWPTIACSYFELAAAAKLAEIPPDWACLFACMHQCWTHLLFTASERTCCLDPWIFDRIMCVQDNTESVIFTSFPSFAKGLNMWKLIWRGTSLS